MFLLPLTCHFKSTENNAFCGNQIVEEGEECDCGSSDTGDCDEVDPCCKPGECELKESAQCRLVMGAAAPPHSAVYW